MASPDGPPLATQSGDNIEVGPSIQELLVELAKVYTTKDVLEQVCLIDKLYADQAVFIDNMICASGKKAVKLQLYSLIKLFGSVAVSQEQPTTKQSIDVQEVSFKNTQKYTFERTGFISKRLLPEEVELQVLTTLSLDRLSGKITRHEDAWQNFGSQPVFLRKFAAGSANTIFRICGWESQLKRAGKASKLAASEATPTASATSL